MNERKGHPQSFFWGALLLCAFACHLKLMTMDLLPYNTAVVEEHQATFAVLNEKVPNTQTSTIPQSGLFLHVQSWREGMSGWKRSLANIIVMSQKLNATLVEPGIENGRLVVQGNIWLTEVLQELSAPMMIPLHEFQALNISTVFEMCLDKCLAPQKGVCKKRKASRPCGTIPSDYKKPISFNLSAAVETSSTQRAVLRIHKLWKDSLIKMGIEMGNGDVIKLHDDDASNQIRHKFQFHPSLFRLADSALQLMGFGNSDEFGIIHWRAELPNMDYMECAKSIVQTKENMLSAASSRSNAAPPRFLLVSSLSVASNTTTASHPLFWGGAQALSNNSTAQQALQYLLGQGDLAKVDQVFKALDIRDWIIAAVLDLILAQKSVMFATCTNKCKDCLKCNHAGSFAWTAISMRKENRNSSVGSYPCWPVGKDYVLSTS